MSTSYTPAPVSGSGAASTHFEATSLSGDHRVDALLGASKWGGGIGTGVNLTFSFPNGGSVWSKDYADEPENNLSFFSAADKAAARQAIKAWEKVANIEFTEIAETRDTVGDIRFARSSEVGSFAAYASYPGSYARSGDVWVRPGFDVTTQFGIEVLLHEIGHALGLKHPFDGPDLLPRSEDNTGNTVMSYTRTGQQAHITPQGFDVLAIEFLYGEKGSENAPLDTTISSWGGPGADSLAAGSGDDQLLGGDGDDQIVAGAGADNIWGEAGDDALNGGADDDYLSGGEGGDILLGGAGADTIWGEAGHDSIAGGEGDDYINGGEGRDIAVFEASYEDVSVTVLGSTLRVIGEGDDNIYDVEFVAFGDEVYTKASLEGLYWLAMAPTPFAVDGGAGGERLNGSFGNDYIRGLGGDDIIKADAGDDIIEGGDGAEIILSGTGNDRISGGRDRDVIKSGDGDDVIHGGDGDDVILSGNGDDSIFGGAGDDVIKPGRGDDAIVAGAGDDVVVGFRTNEMMFGGDGDDLLLGNVGDDVLAGGAGNDRLQGGPGRDAFIYDDANFGHDRIVLDFRPTSDVIDFRGSGIESDDITLNEVGGKVVLRVIGVDSSIVISNDRYGALAVSDFDDGALIF